MKDFILRKKLAELGTSAKAKVDYFFEGATNSANEFVDKFKSMSNKTRLKVVKSVGAGLLSVLVLAGFTGCMDGLGNITDNPTTTTPKTEASSVYDPTTIPEETKTPQETTTGPAVTTKPNDVATTPQETTSQKPTETSKQPEETTKEPEETSKQPEETTKEPEETSKQPEETTTPSDDITTPEEDLPADEDGYAYPEFFANLVRQTIIDERLFYESYNGVNYRKYVENKTPEIVFVERGESTKNEGVPIIICAKYPGDTNGSKHVYARLSFKIGENDYRMLGFPQLYASYAEYIDAVQKALENRAELANADISQLYMEQDAINESLGENFARFVGEKFVDASVNSVRSYPSSSGGLLVQEISGFAYDSEGKSYSYVVKLQCKAEKIITNDDLIKAVEAGEIDRSDFATFESRSREIASVFQEQENEAE